MNSASIESRVTVSVLLFFMNYIIHRSDVIVSFLFIMYFVFSEFKWNCFFTQFDFFMKVFVLFYVFHNCFNFIWGNVAVFFFL